VERAGSLVVVVFGNGGGISGSQNLCLKDDAGHSLVKAIGVAVGTEESFL